MSNSIAIKLVHIFCLLVAMTIVLMLPAKKEIWYDETVSMMCSKGISADEPERMAAKTTVTADELEQLNTAGNVFHATVTDNANSFLYNIGLHWYTNAFGTTLDDYVAFSKICALCALLAFYALCTLFFGYSFFTPLAVILLAIDIDFVGMSHEIRAYMMGMFFVSAAGIHFFRFIKEAKPINLFFTALCSVGAVLSHFLSVYVVVTFCIGMLWVHKGKLFKPGNILAVVVPILLVGWFFLEAYPGLRIMSMQNAHIQEREQAGGFSAWVVITGTLKFVALNFKSVFPAFMGKAPVFIVSALAVLVLYIAALRSAADAAIRRNLHLLFWLGVSSSIFLALLCFRSGHYTALYYRYHSFSVPFATLFTVYAVFVILQGSAGRVVKAGVLLAVLGPCCLLFVSSVRHATAVQKYNHIAIAQEIQRTNATQLEAPTWKDVLLVHTVMPVGYKIDYVRTENAPYFTLHSGSGVQQVPVLVNNR